MIRIARLDLERWGHFDGRRLTFGQAGRLHVIFGANEAGKSTTRRAVSALLFGVPERTTDTFGRPGADLRVGALLELDGTPVEVVRRKGRKNTLLDADGEALDPAPLDRALGGLSGEVHAGLFEITHDSLVQGGHELLAGRGAVGESLFAAAAGTSRLHALLRRLEGDADAVFTPLGRKKDLNMLLAQHAEAVRTLRDAALRPPQHEALARALEGLEAAYARAGGELDEVERERARLERLRGALPLAALRATRALELEELGEVAALAADAPTRRSAAQERRDAARARGAAAERDVERRRARFAALAVDEGLLPFVTELEDVHAQGTAVAQDAARREDLAAQRTALAPRLEQLLVSLAPALGGRSLRELALDEDARARLEECLQARTGVEQAVSSAREGLAEAVRVAERAQRAADEAPAEIDDDALAAALRAARGAGPVDEDAARARAEERSALAAAERTAAQMRPALDAAMLAALPVPDQATVERLLVAVLEAEQVAAGLVLEAEGIEDRTRLLERQRDQLAAEAPVLDASALEHAREERAQAWEAVREALGSGVVFEDAAALVAEHERAVAAADEVADVRLQRAEDVARLADVERELTVLAHDVEELGHRRERHAAVVERACAAWSSAWEPAGEHAPAPSQAGAWLSARDTVLSQLADAASATERAEAAEALRAQHRDALLATLDIAADAALPLSALIELADGRLDALRGEGELAGRAAEAVARTVAEREDAEVGLARAEAALARWQDEWSALRAGCGLAETLEPADALGALRSIEQAARDQERLATLSADIDAVDARRHAFETAVAEFITATGATDLAEQPATSAAAVLHRRATEARAAAAEREALAAELAILDAEQAEAIAIVAETEQELSALRAAAAASDDAELLLREEASARAAELRAEITALDGDLARAGGAPAAEVAAAVADLDADALPARVEELEDLAVLCRSERDEAGEALTRARDELARLERSEEAAQAAQAKASLEAQIQELAERYARARLAQRVLRDAIARYRSAHEGPLLARANALFPALTCERFARLETDVDERDEDVLIAVTADGARRRVQELSDGTREQLFLALRLAAIERHVATAEAVPVLFDDVLLESDDERAQRILSALAELATKTQVLVLTHHRHLVEIARATLPKRRLDVIELSEATATDVDVEVDAVPPVPTLADELEAALVGAGPPDDFGEQQTLL
ncbi:AAA family ATPase [Baekduia sp.]|uniref:AAA family ATPase n=1 Tax=Baekduia sp. TaxID=2600305 RepID=UPI002E0C9D9D|nr:AAA family ATPase [Baekduia sp.]